MHSSTSNSSHRAPRGPWLHTWLVALVVLVAFFGTVELTFRMRGMSPAYQDTPRHWGYWRGQASAAGPDAVALAGSSRTQLGLDPETMAQAAPHRQFFQLAMNGGTPLPILANLADDPTFTGTVLVEGYPSALFMTDTARRRAMAPSFQAFDNRSSIEDLEARLRAAFQGILVVARPEFRPTLFAVTLLSKRALPSESYTRMHFNRWTAADYQMPHPSGEDWAILPNDILPHDQIEQRFDAVEQHVEAIEKRGGRVLFFRMPSSKHVREAERQHLSRQSYWERHVVARFGDSALHFEDFEDLNRFECPDGSHLDYRDAQLFSSSLAARLFPSE